jgi:hypothetical protein
VPFDLAFQLDEVTRTAMAIQFSQFEGNRFNVDTMTFEEMPT